MASYLARFGFGLFPSVLHEYRCKQAYDKAKDIPADDLLVRKILGENHSCRVNHESSDGNDDASASGSLFGYSVVHMTEEAFTTDEGTKAHELCHIKNQDGIVGKLVPGMTAAGLSMALLRWIRPSKYIALRVGQSILKEGFSLGVGILVADPAYSRYCEKRADLMGFSFCSKEGQSRYIQSFRNRIQEDKEALATASSDCIRYSEGLAQLEQQLEKCMEQSEIEQREIRIETLRWEITAKKHQLLISESILKEDPPQYLFWGKIPVAGTAENGDNLADWDHPLRSERIAYLTQAYRDLHGEEPPEAH